MNFYLTNDKICCVPIEKLT